ncbi:hypothetical protein [Lysobacter enzymogenes]|uniref:hypothetical protein n=1 Tax=Lysobacter enzymogenes TaxID=69 RepID=UPI000F4CD332|nr:hypothetical protein [Lysobacter enzymogenes]
MDSAVGWVGLGAAIAAVIAQCRLARRGERWIAAHWPYLHGELLSSPRWLHRAGALGGGAGLSLACGAHGLPDTSQAFLAYLIFGSAGVAAGYLWRALFYACLLLFNWAVLPELLHGLWQVWRHRRDPAAPPSDWLPPGSARLGAPVPTEREP